MFRSDLYITKFLMFQSGKTDDWGDTYYKIGEGKQNVCNSVDNVIEVVNYEKGITITEKKGIYAYVVGRNERLSMNLRSLLGRDMDSFLKFCCIEDKLNDSFIDRLCGSIQRYTYSGGTANVSYFEGKTSKIVRIVFKDVIEWHKLVG